MWFRSQIRHTEPKRGSKGLVKHFWVLWAGPAGSLWFTWQAEWPEPQEAVPQPWWQKCGTDHMELVVYFITSSFAGSVLPDGKCCPAAELQLLLTSRLLEMQINAEVSEPLPTPAPHHTRRNGGDGTTLGTAAAVPDPLCLWEAAGMEREFGVQVSCLSLGSHTCPLQAASWRHQGGMQHSAVQKDT